MDDEMNNGRDFENADLNNLLETIETPVPECAENNEQEEKFCAEDPLQFKLKRPFPWEYNEDDLKCDIKVEEELVTITERSNRNKRVRLSTELKGRNGCSWSTISTRTSEFSIPPEQLQPKCKGPARKICNPLDAWHFLMDDPILVIIVKHTNDEIRRRKGKSSFQRPTDLVEFRSWLGLNYLCGLFRNSEHKGPIEELWSIELGNAIFRATMSPKRYEYLAECVRFSESSVKSNSLESVSQIWQKFIINCRSYYAPSTYCTIDDVILNSTDTKCPYQFCLQKDFSQIGLRLVMLCDTKTLYMCNAFVATNEIAGEKDVLNLINDIKNTKRNVTMNERYTSISLAQKLGKHQLTLTGALPVTANEIPQDLLRNKVEQKLYSGSLALTTCLDEREIPTGILLSTDISNTINDKKLYAKTYDSCERFYKLASAYSTRFASASKTSWSMEFFHELLNFTAVNAWILLRLSDNGDTGLEHRDFIRQLGLYLTQQQLKRRLKRNDRLSLVQKLQICELLGEPTETLLTEATATAKQAVGAGTIPQDKVEIPKEIILVSKAIDQRRRCRKCPSKISTKTKVRCQQCQRPLCQKHLILRCTDCTGVQEVPGENDKKGKV